jgi:hypothetical protein
VTFLRVPVGTLLRLGVLVACLPVDFLPRPPVEEAGEIDEGEIRGLWGRSEGEGIECGPTTVGVELLEGERFEEGLVAEKRGVGVSLVVVKESRARHDIDSHVPSGQEGRGSQEVFLPRGVDERGGEICAQLVFHLVTGRG